MVEKNGLPSGYVKIAMENHHRNSGFTHLLHGDFPVRELLVITRLGKRKRCQSSSWDPAMSSHRSS